MKRTWIRVALVLAPVLAGVWLVRAWPTFKPPAPAAGEVVRAARRDLDSLVKATGIIRPVVGAEVKVGSRASGVVERLDVRVGDHVAKGQLLAVLDTRELAARSDLAAAALLSARAGAEYAARERSRSRQLAEASAVSQSDHERAESGARVSEARVAEAAATLALARVQLEQARIRAPISGVVASVSTQEGETVSATLAAPTFVTIVDLDRLELWSYVDETDIGRIQLGQAASFSVDTYPGRSFEGQVTAIYPKAEIRDNVVNYVVVVRLAPQSDQLLRPDMTASVRIVLAERHSVVAVPRRALHRDGGRTFVLRKEGDNQVEREVRTGARDETHVEILEGLREGDEVLVGDAAAT